MNILDAALVAVGINESSIGQCPTPPDGFGADSDLALPPDASLVDIATVLDVNDYGDSEPLDVEGVGTTVAASLASAVAAALIGVAATEAFRRKAETESVEVVKKLRAVGIDYVDPGASPRKGWVKIQSNDRRLLRALAFLGDNRRDKVLQDLAAKGFGFQMRKRLDLSTLKPGKPDKGAGVPRRPSALPAIEEDRLPIRTPTARPASTLPPLEEDRGAVRPWKPASTIPALEEERAPLRAPAASTAEQTEELAFSPATAEEATSTAFQGVPNVEGFLSGFATAAGAVLGAFTALVAAVAVGAGITIGPAVVKAVEVSKVLRAAGFELLPPGDSPKPGWVAVPVTDKRVSDALEAVPMRDELLRGLSEKGWRLQERAGSLSGESDVTAEDAAGSDAYATAQNVEGVGTVAATAAVGAAALAAAAWAARNNSRSKERIIQKLLQQGLEVVAPGDAENAMAKKVEAGKYVWVLTNDPAVSAAYNAFTAEVPTAGVVARAMHVGYSRDGRDALANLSRAGYRLARRAETSVGGPGAVAAIAAGVLAAGALVAAHVASRPKGRSVTDDDVARLRRIVQKHGLLIGPLGAPPPGYEEDAGSLVYTPGLAAAISEFDAESPEIDGMAVLYALYGRGLGLFRRSAELGAFAIDLNDPGARVADALLPGSGLAAQTVAQAVKAGKRRPKKRPLRAPRVDQALLDDIEDLERETVELERANATIGAGDVEMGDQNIIDATFSAIGGVGTVAAVVGGGLVAGGLLALAYKGIASGGAPPEAALPPAAAPLPPPPKAAMTPPTTTILNTAVTAAQKADLAKEYSAGRSPASPPASASVSPEDAKLAAKSSANLELVDVTEKLRKAKAELTAMLTPDSSGALKTDSTHVKWKTEEIAALERRVKDLQFVVSGATPNDVDRTLATANDAVTVASSLLAAVDATQKIVKREAKSKVDQKCRQTVAEWLTKHPWLHRLAMATGGPNLHDLAGLAESAESFSERYADRLFAFRSVGILGDAHGSCDVTPQEDRLVLLSLGASEEDVDSLGLTKPQEDSVYTLASRGVASVANLFAPGTAQPLTEMSDAVALLATGRQMAPGGQSAAQKPKKRGDPCAKPKSEAREARADAEVLRAAVRQWKESHPIVNSLFGSKLRSVGGAEPVSVLDAAISAVSRDA
jgi:hypothetical protein